MTDDQQDAPDDDRREDDASPPPSTAPAPKPRGQRRLYEKAVRGRLVEWDMFQAVDPDDPIKITVAGGSISGSHGNAEWIGEAIKRAAQFVAQLGNADPQLKGLAFGNSVSFEFQAAPVEIGHAEEALLLADASVEGPVRNEALVKAIPPTIVGGFMAVEFFREVVADPVQTSIEYGTAVTQTWVSFARHLAADDVTLEITPPGELLQVEPALIRSSVARRSVDVLKEEGEEEHATVTAFGVLTLADADHNIVGLKLDTEAQRDPYLKSKRLVKCEYNYDVGVSIRDQALWNKEVRARIRVYFDTRDGHATLNAPRYRLMSVEPRYSN